MEGPKDPLVGRTIDQKYHLIRRIGSGGMALVYLADLVEGGQPVAVKFLKSVFVNLPGFVKRFQREAEALSLLSHDNCVGVKDFGMAVGLPYLVMDFADGVTLAQALKSGPMAPLRAIRIARQLLAGLAHAHDREVVHRDLKPGNVMVLGQGVEESVKIMDFGTAQLLSADHSGSARGTEIGTPWYMAPEQISGQPTGPRTDIYPVGVMLFEMLLGRRPYDAQDPLRVLQMQIHDPIPSLRALEPSKAFSPELEAVIVKAMQKNKDGRFESALAFDKALADLPELNRHRRSSASREVPIATLDTAPPPQTAAAPARWPMLLALLSVLLLMVVSVIGLLLIDIF